MDGPNARRPSLPALRPVPAVTLTEGQYRRALLALLLLAALLRLVGLNWDAGRGLHPDESNLIRAALTLGIDGRLLPEFHAYNDLALWLPRLLSLPFCGSEDGACLTLVARVLSALLSLAMILPGAALARRLAGGGSGQAGLFAGLAAALALATSAPLVQWAHFGTTESAIALLVLVLWWLAMRWLDGALPDRRMALMAALALGIGFGFKTTAVAVCVIPLTAFALGGRIDAARLRMLALFAVMAVMQALAFAPSVWLATSDWLAVMRFENGVVTGSLAVFWTAQFTGAVNGLFEARQLWSMTSGAGVLLALAGLGLMPRGGWRLALPGLVFALVYAALTFGWHAKFVRYLAPLMPVVLVLAGVGLGRLASGLAGRTAAAAGLAGLGLMTLAGLDSAAAYLRPDPRLAIEAQLQALSAADDTVAIEPRDLPQAGGRPVVLLPLAEDGLTPDTLAAALAGAEWLILASRRNWEVLPRQPGANPVICAYYAGLADGLLGLVPVRRADRNGVLGPLLAPGLTTEETRLVFDRPEVILFRNVERLSAPEIAARLGPRDPATCSAERLHRAWRQGA